jgi:putative MATE family efflux protein
MVNNLLRGSGDALRPMIFMVTGSALNIILDPLLIFGLGPFPEMGIRGAALATIVSQMLSAILAFSYLVLLRKSSYRISWRHLRPSWPVLRDIYRVGLPTIIINLGESAVFALLNNVLSSFGSVAIAAAGVGIRVADLAWMPIWGVSQGLLPVIGFNFGARIWRRLWGAVKIASLGLASFSLLSLLILELLAPKIVGIFSPTPEMLEIAVPALRIMLSGIAIFGPTILFVVTFQGLSKGKDALILSLVRQIVIFVPLLYFLSWRWGLTGVWLAIPITDILGFLLSGLWLLREYKRQRRTGAWVDLLEVQTDTEN